MTKKEKIKIASAEARRKMGQLDEQTLNDLEGYYKKALQKIYALIKSHADKDQIVRLEVLTSLKRQIALMLVVLNKQQQALLDASFVKAASIGTGAMSSAIDAATLSALASDAVLFVQSFKMADGLQLSDRIWRLERGTKEAIIGHLQTAIISGDSASKAAQDFINRGIPLPKDIQDKINTSAVDQLRASLGDILLKKGGGGSYANARRLFRTEINRAHGEAYHKAVFEHPDAVGTRFLLSPNHPKKDICDTHASADLYGLGKGVYPKGKNPWPAHPNTLSYTEIVFSDEI